VRDLLLLLLFSPFGSSSRHLAVDRSRFAGSRVQEGLTSGEKVDERKKHHEFKQQQDEIMSAANDDAEDRQLLVTQVGHRATAAAAVLLDDDHHLVGSPTSSGFVSGSMDDDDADDEPSDQLTPEAAKFRRRYRELLRRSREEDLTSVEETNCIYQAGYDKQGRAVIVFIGKWFKHSQIDLEKAFLYLLRVVEPIADHDYVVIYFHTRTSRDNIPSYWFIKEVCNTKNIKNLTQVKSLFFFSPKVYNTLPYKFKKNLRRFFVVHPTVWTKVTCWWFSTFMAPAIKVISPCPRRRGSTSALSSRTRSRTCTPWKSCARWWTTRTSPFPCS
jgi:hypothetical protein